MLLGDGLHGMLQNAVDAVLDRNFGVSRFDVNVTGAPLESGEDDRFDEADYGARGGVTRQAIAGNRLFAFLVLLGGLHREGFGGLLEDALRLLGTLQNFRNLSRR